MLRRLLSDNRTNANFSLNKNIVIRLPCPPLAKRGSLTHSQALALSKRARDVTALRCSEPLRYKVGGPSKVFAILCGMGPPGDGVLNSSSLQYRSALVAVRMRMFFKHSAFYTREIKSSAVCSVTISTEKYITNTASPLYYK